MIMIRNKFAQVFASALLALCLGVNSQAQTINEQLDFLFAPLDKSRITTGMLLERGLFPHSPLPFNGILTDSSFTTPLLQRSLYVGLHSSVVSLIGMTSPEVFYGNLSAASPDGVELSMLHYNMNRIKDNAMSSGLLSYQNGQLHDVPGSATPYQPFTLFAVAPVNAEAWGTTVTFTLSSLLHMTNSTAPISLLQIDPGDGGGYRTIAFNAPLSVTYPTAGQKVVRVALTPSGGQTLRSHFRLTVHTTTQPPQPSPYDYSDDAIPFAPVQGVHSGGVAFVKYSTGNTSQTLRNPLIVAEGIDPSSVLSIIPNYSFYDFYRKLWDVSLDGGSRFWNALISEYDIVFLDYTNGVDDIFRNARLLEKVIEWANAQKANVPDAQPNVVLGVSMGGLVSRVALRRMEVEGKSHDTRLFISFDSPHKRANVPPAYQALAWHVNSYLSIIDPSLYHFLNAPATKQMLKYYANNSNNTFISTHHNTFMAQYDALGFPTTTRNVAIANGSNAGASIFNPYSSLINVVHNVGKFKFTVKGYAMPNKLNRVVYDATVEWKVSGSFWQWLFGASTMIADLKKYYSNTSQLSFDGAPGGYYPLSWFGGLPAGFDDYISYNNFTFIPISSALAVNSNDPAEVMANQNLIGTSRTPLATYYSQAVNQSHLQLTPQNAQFILNELGEFNLCIPASGVMINGPTILCTSNSTFTLSNLPAGVTVNWTKSSNLSYHSGQGTNSYTVSAASSTTSGAGWVRAKLNSPCGEIVLPDYIVWVSNTPTQPTITVPIEPLNCQYQAMVWASSSPSDVTYSWSVTNGTIISQDGAELFVQPTCSRPWILGLGVSASNQCGTSAITTKSVTISNGGMINPRLLIAPNPASVEVTISEIEPTNENIPWVLRLMSQQGAVMVNVTTTLPQTLSVQGLQPGVYVLHARRGSYSEQQVVVVE